MIKAVVFDLGKVIFDLSFDRVFHAWAKAGDKTFEEVKGRFEFSELFDLFEKEAITPNEFRTSVCKMIEIPMPGAVFDAGWCDLYMDVYEGTGEMLDGLRQKYRILALTNTNIIHQPVWTEKYKDILKHFEKVFISNEMKVRKPEKAIYEEVLKYLEMQPGEVVFLDDNPANVKGAEDVGIKGILVDSPEQMRADLDSLLS